MLVTRNNQHVAFSEFQAALEKSDFCAIDEEMTGVNCPHAPRTFGQSPATVYDVNRSACQMFNAFQFGIAIFIPREDKEGCYDVLPYNFFLLNAKGDVRLDLGTVPFHNSNKMDFQRWLTDGMRYCTAKQEKKMREQHLQAPLLPTKEEQLAAKKIKKSIVEWYNSLNSVKEEGDTINSLTLSEPCTRAVAKSVKLHFDSQSNIPVTIRFDGRPYIGENITFTVTPVDKAVLETQRADEAVDRERKLELQLGFRHFWNAIVASKKTMVGHNCFLDILFMLHMHEAELPENYDDFKRLTRQTFPCFYDTKTLSTVAAGEQKFAVTHLGAIYTELRQRFHCGNALKLRETFRLPLGFYDYDEIALKGSGKAHEAGYDAYMTGVCFHFLRKLHKDQLSEWKNVISAFGSNYYCCIDEQRDRLVSPSSFVITSSVPCYGEHVEALLFATEDREKIIVDGKVDVRKRSFSLVPMDVNSDGLATRFCTIFNVEHTAESVLQRLRSAEKTPLAANVPVEIIPNLGVVTLESTISNDTAGAPPLKRAHS